MARPRKTDDVETRARLLAAAEVEFGRHGFDAARLEDVARAAGIRRPSLLYHFETKHQLYAAVIHECFARLTGAMLAALAAEGSVAERIDAAAVAFQEFTRTHPAIAPLILREVIDERGPGRALLAQDGAAMLDALEGFVRKHGKGQIRRRLPVRAAILQLGFGALVRQASGELRAPLWGPKDELRTLARALMLEEA